MFRLLLTLLRHRVTYRFLLVLAAALGVTTLTGDITQLEALVCSLVSCTD
ncbi:hypothetical protein [Yersinia phage vB_YenP_AP10]|uniref:DUF5465 domain-containing protein n=1 Tax=Yersinia phage vB_YenP_AP10 TaxID=1735591 RepID=A0A0N7J842_9CAUD|nr:hypothetical protein AU149_gp47 [Yersinia phage vB_YenP_AP10]ALK86974.1 hypothetical protein [Yersinia phage vB_YenP_AP10]